MRNAFLERSFDDPMTVADFAEMAASSMDCLNLHNVDWQHSMLSSDGTHLICWFSAADLESVRIALRTDGIDMTTFWPGTVHDAPGVSAADIASANVIVVRSFDAAARLEDIQRIEDAGAGCLEMRNVKFRRTFFANERKRMLCLYSAPDAESARQAQREAGLPFDDVWSFAAIRPEDLSENS
jgi:hypothetical protein